MRLGLNGEVGNIDGNICPMLYEGELKQQSRVWGKHDISDLVLPRFQRRTKLVSDFLLNVLEYGTSPHQI